MLKAWNRSRYGDDCNRLYMATVAVQYGHLDALEALIDALVSADPKSESHWLPQQARPAVLRATDFRGANTELESWFRANRNALRFDADAKKFVVTGEAKTVE